MCLKAGMLFFEVISKCPIHNFSLINAKSSWIAPKVENGNLRSNVTVKFIALIFSDHEKYKRYWHHKDDMSATSSLLAALLKDHFFEELTKCV